jgi:hypothetical protein
MRDEIDGWLEDWKLLTIGCVASYLDGLIIAQAWDWLMHGHRISIWLLL